MVANVRKVKWENEQHSTGKHTDKCHHYFFGEAL